MQSRTVLLFAIIFSIAAVTIILIPSVVLFGVRLETGTCQILNCTTSNETDYTKYNTIYGYTYYANTIFNLKLHNNIYIGNGKESFDTQEDSQQYCNKYIIGSKNQCYYFSNSIANTLSLQLSDIITMPVSLITVFGGGLLCTAIVFWTFYITKDACCCKIKDKHSYQRIA